MVFCASSKIIKAFSSVLPLINAKGAISIIPDSILFSNIFFGIKSLRASYKGLKYGSIFSFKSPGKKPNLSPASTAGRESIILEI